MHPEENGFIQIVLDKPDIPVSLVKTSSSPETTLTKLKRPPFTIYKPKHLFTIGYSATGEVACASSSPFGEVVRYIKGRPKSETIGFWSDFLKGAKACEFPVLQLVSDPSLQDIHEGIYLEPELLSGVTEFCKKNGVTRSIFMHIAWSLVLSHFTGFEEVCFGYMASGRDAPVEGIKRIFGPLANMVISRIDLRTPLKALMKSTAAILKEHRHHQQTSLAELQHSLGVSGRLFNTMVSLLRTDPFGAGEKQTFSFEKYNLVSPHEFDLVLEGYLNPDSVGVTMYYRTAFISQQMAQEIVQNPLNGPYDTDPTVSLPDNFFKYVIGSDKTSTAAYWKGQFAGLEIPHSPNLKDLMSNRTRDGEVALTVRGLGWNTDFGADVVAKAAWYIMIAQIAESNEVLFGITVTGRQAELPGIAKLTGTTASVVPIHITLNWDESLNEFLQTVQHNSEKAVTYEGTGMHWIRQLSDEAASACDFESLLAFRNAEADNGDKLDKAFDQYGIVADCQLANDGTLQVRISFNSQEIENSRITRIAHQFEHALRQLSNMANLKEKLRCSAGIGPRDLGDVWKWNADVPKPVKSSIHELVKSKVLSQPGALAIHAWDGNWTYEELDEQSTNLAHRLIDMGIGIGDIVPMCFEKSKWMSVVMLGVSKTGATGVGIDPTQPEEWLRTITAQVKAPLIISSVAKKDLAESIGKCDVLVVSSETVPGPTKEHTRELPTVDPSTILYMVFTSGSTGTPKGVLVSHRSYCSAVTYQHEYFGFTGTSRVFDFSSYVFDAAWYNLFHTLTSGGCLCVPSNEERQNDLSGCFEKYNVTMTFLTPSVARHIDPKVLGRLSTLMLGGELVLPNDVILESDKTQIKIIYGPSECTPMTTRHDVDSEKRMPIGRGIGVCTWVVNPDDYQSLAPVGVVGDLVRYDDDGAIVYVRRKDTQVKIRGQRVELAEVEQHIQVALQQTRLGGGNLQVVAETIRSKETDVLMLVAFISLDGAESRTEEDHANLVRLLTTGLAENLAQVVPSYMIPNAFIPIPKIPMTITGKTDRVRLRNIGVSTWLEHRAVANKTETVEASSDMEKALQEVWGAVLNLQTETISVNQAFTRLGGDSITAMQVASKCRARSIGVTVSDVLQAGTIQKLALRCKKLATRNPLLSQIEDDVKSTKPFALSPIQKKYYNIFPEGINHFNQSFILDMNRPIQAAVLHKALQAVVGRHGLLRARYQKDPHGFWEQFIAKDDSRSFAFTEHNVSSRADVLDIAQDRQTKLDTSVGPVFAADLFNITVPSSQMLVLSAHHVVVDLVSWRIIWNDIEEHVKLGSLRSQAPPSFRTWCRLQGEMASELLPNYVLPFDVPAPEIDFWGLPLAENTRSTSEDCVMVLGSDASELLLGKSNYSLRTEALDIILGSYAYSFRKAFSERRVPAIFVEGHGREQSERLPLDVSGTVGWFTTVHPLPIGITSENTIVDAVRLAKDTRRKVPGKGQPYFASRYHNKQCGEKFKDHDDVELLLNFAGRYQQLESDDALFKMAKLFEDGRTLEVVSGTSKRLALIEANMAVQDRKLVVTFTFNRNMKYQDRLRRRFQEFIQTLELAVQSLLQTPPSFTLSDLPLLPLSYRGLDRLLKQQLPAIGIKAEDIVDIYPTSPLQEGILLSSTTGVSSYATFWIWNCVSNPESERISSSRLEEAWRAVVGRHAILSTIFAPHPEDSGFVQIVLNGSQIRVSHMAISSGNPSEVLYGMDRPAFAAHEPEHAFTVCRSETGQVSCRLDINHTLVDGASLTPLVQDIVAAYDKLAQPLTPSFKEMVQYISSIPNDKTISYWANFLNGVEACKVATSYSPSEKMVKDTFRYIPLPGKLTSVISEFCREIGITRAIFLQVAWAMLLSQLTGKDEVCFGYLASGRNAPVDDIEKMVGPLANMLISRINLRPERAKVLKSTSDDSIQHLEYQHASLAEIQHAIGLSGRRLFNTAMTVREADRFDGNDTRSISLQYHDHQDPHEYDLLLSSHLDKENMKVSVQVREATISRQLADDVAGILVKAIEHLLTTMTQQPKNDNAEDAIETESLYHNFFGYVVGKDEDATLAFWKNQFTDLDAAYFPPLKAATNQIRQEAEVRSTLKLELQTDDSTAAAKVRAAWSIVAARNAGSSEARFGAICANDQTSTLLPIRVIVDWEGSGTKLLQARRDPDVVSGSRLTRIANQFEHALCCLSDIKLREQRLWDTVSITPQDVKDIWAWNTPLPEPVEACVHDLINARVQLNPKAPAICAWDGDLTYGELDQLSTKLAYKLASMGVGPGKFVPLCFGKSMWTPVAMLAVMKTGAASVAMDTTQPEGRLRTITEQVDGKVLLSSVSNEELASRLGSDNVVLVSAKSLADLDSAPEKDGLPVTSPSDALFAVFTSGSTGTPKGTMLTHQNFSSVIGYQQEALGLTSHSRVFDFASYAFDIAWCNFLHALTCGGCLCIPSETDRRNNIEGSITALRANYAHITPTILRYLNWSKLDTITVLNLSGEAVLAKDTTLAPEGVKMVNAYGPAETNVVTIHDLSASRSGQVSIGRGAGACTWVVDVEDTNALAPIGTIGELWIEGPLVGNGYLNDSEKTSASFVEDPTWLLRGAQGKPGRRGRVYRTGDLVRYNEDGTLVYIGRKDTQVKIRGQRVELGEIEHQVQQALEKSTAGSGGGSLQVIAETIQTQQSENTMLVAFISLAGAEDMTEVDHSNAVQQATSRLTESLSDVLPVYMVPAAYIPVRDIPLTATGKTDRRRLKAIGASKTAQELAALTQSGDDRRQPNTDMECVMQKLWAGILNISADSISADDSFFRIGGDSIGAMRLVSIARDQDLSFTVGDIFQNPVLHSLSALVLSRNSTEDDAIQPFALLKPNVDPAGARVSVAKLCGVQERQVLDIFPCTPLQESLMIRTASATDNFFMSRHIMEISSDNQAVSRNTILRTRIVNIPDQDYVQVVLDDTVEWTPAQTIEDCDKYSKSKLMGQGTPLVRFAVVESDNGSRRDFVWELHWAVYDGWGLRLLLADAEKLYFNPAERRLENMLAFTKYIMGLDENEATMFWRYQFEDLKKSHFPPLRSSAHQPQIDNEVRLVAQGLDWSRGDFTAATIIRAALSLVFAWNLDSDEALFGVTVTGRQAAVTGIERMAGPAFATMPIRVPVNWQGSVKGLLETVQNQATDMVPFEQTSLEQIRQAGDEAASACNFQALLVIQSAIKKGDFRYREEEKKVFVEGPVAGKGAIVELGQRTGEYPMYVECQLDTDGDVNLRVCFDSHIVGEEQMTRFINQVRSSLRQLSDAKRGGDRLCDLVTTDGQDADACVWTR
ncbi:Nonribosomal peptide synthase atnA [Cladobotryum mycophilum]|uniref:Nonribosomal peptide synthase atnA n=1 Tax=Cladobotryum mycophilum TaxID=491253 RepID=A0ABR0SAV0_9HYPO